MSTLWTPSGEHIPDEGPDEQQTSQGDHDAEAVAAELERVRAELAGTPVVDIVANHAVGLWQLAVLHLTPSGDDLPRFDEAGLAIDALAALVEGLGDRLGEHAEPLRDALAQLRLVYVQVRDRHAAS